MPPDGFAVCFAPGMSEDEQNELTQEAEKVYEEEYEAWEKNKICPHHRIHLIFFFRLSVIQKRNTI